MTKTCKNCGRLKKEHPVKLSAPWSNYSRIEQTICEKFEAEKVFPGKEKPQKKLEQNQNETRR